MIIHYYVPFQNGRLQLNTDSIEEEWLGCISGMQALKCEKYEVCNIIFRLSMQESTDLRVSEHVTEFSDITFANPPPLNPDYIQVCLQGRI